MVNLYLGGSRHATRPWMVLLVFATMLADQWPRCITAAYSGLTPCPARRLVPSCAVLLLL